MECESIFIQYTCKHVISIFAEYWLIIVLCSLSKYEVKT